MCRESKMMTIGKEKRKDSNKIMTVLKKMVKAFLRK